MGPPKGGAPEGPGASNTTKIPRKDPTHPSGPHLSGLHPRGVVQQRVVRRKGAGVHRPMVCRDSGFSFRFFGTNTETEQKQNEVKKRKWTKQKKKKSEKRNEKQTPFRLRPISNSAKLNCPKSNWPKSSILLCKTDPPPDCPKFLSFFFLLPPQTSFFCFLWGSSRGIVVSVQSHGPSKNAGFGR